MAFFEDPSTRGYLLSASPRFASPSSPSSITGKARSSPDSPMSSPGPSSADIQAHIYNSFLEGKTADVALHVQGSWNAVYKLHRVVLIQAGFFRSLFDGGFAESQSRLKISQGHPEILDIILEDTNITRAAFEVCIARLYGGGPELFVDPSTIPTPAKPLTPSFPIPGPRPTVPAGQQLATPRFLLSMLATSIYLSIPSITRQCLTLVLSSVGPFTVIPYLSFAVGDGIGPLTDQDASSAVGLERVAQSVKMDHVYTHSTHRSRTHHEGGETSSSVAGAQQPTDAGSHPEHGITDDHLSTFELESKKEDPSVCDTSSASSVRDDGHNQLFLYYGAISDKIGEAVACWLARWGVDMLHYEQQVVDAARSTTGMLTSSERTMPRRATVSTPRPNLNGMVVFQPLPPHVPVIWRRGGLPPKWIRALLSADTMFVRDEKERYDVAKLVVELRRSEGIDVEEELEFTKLFTDGIYYQNMVLEDLVAIFEDVSPTTGQPYVSSEVLQSAHWNQALLRHKITGRSVSSTSPPSSPSPSGPRDKELGVAIPTADVVAKLQGPNQGAEKDKFYWPVLVDASLRIGDGSAIEGSTMDELFERPSTSNGKGAIHASTSESTFFGLKTNKIPAPMCAQVPKISKWSPYPPCRFAVEFWDVEALREKSRLHSHTVWYAGSLFNVYVQLVRKKGIQLGVYLHRQSSIDPIPASSAPFGSQRLERSHVRNISTPNVHPSVSTPNIQQTSSSISPPTPTRATTPTSSTTASTSTPNTLPALAPPVAPSQPYRDPRPAVSAYFTISCASATGSSLTLFTSAPDVFSVSQSWGWKSSSLRTEEYLEVTGKDGVPASTMPSEKECSLRVTVVLGLV